MQSIQTFVSRSFACLMLAILCLLAGSCTVVRKDAVQGQEGSLVSDSSSGTEFDARSFVGKNWDSRTLPEIKAGAHPLEEVIGSLARDAEAARLQFGIRKADDLPWSYLVAGKVKIREVRTASAAGIAVLDMKGVEDGQEVQVQIGPVIKSSAVRDCLSYLNFGDFTNQTDFANISREINIRLRDQVLAGLDKKRLSGRTVSFLGVLVEEPGLPLLITPVQLEVEK